MPVGSRATYHRAVLEFAIVMAVILVFVVGLVGGLGWVERRSVRKAPTTDPEQLLRERFARGEIDETEYARRLSILKYGPPLELY